MLSYIYYFSDLNIDFIQKKKKMQSFHLLLVTWIYIGPLKEKSLNLIDYLIYDSDML